MTRTKRHYWYAAIMPGPPAVIVGTGPRRPAALKDARRKLVAGAPPTATAAADLEDDMASLVVVRVDDARAARIADGDLAADDLLAPAPAGPSEPPTCGHATCEAAHQADPNRPAIQRARVAVLHCLCQRCGHTWTLVGTAAPPRCAACKALAWERPRAWERPDLHGVAPSEAGVGRLQRRRRKRAE